MLGDELQMRDTNCNGEGPFQDALATPCIFQRACLTAAKLRPSALREAARAKKGGPGACAPTASSRCRNPEAVKRLF